MLAKTTPRDSSVALAVSLAGGVALFAAHRVHWHPQDMSPGVEGCLTATVLGFVLALLHPLPYRYVIGLSLPLVVGEYLACAYADSHAVGLGVVGMHLLVIGFVGVALARREPRASASRAPLRVERRVSHAVSLP